MSSQESNVDFPLTLLFLVRVRRGVRTIYLRYPRTLPIAGSKIRVTGGPPIHIVVVKSSKTLGCVKTSTLQTSEEMLIRYLSKRISDMTTIG